MAKSKKDTYSYRGWLVSDNFIKRCLAVVGHQFVGGLIVWGVIVGSFLAIGIIFGIIGAIISLFLR